MYSDGSSGDPEIATSRRLLFICACPRSGTTFLADRIGSSADALSLQETPFKFRGPGGVTRHEDAARWISSGDPTLANTGIPDGVVLPVNNPEFYLQVIAEYVTKFCRGKSRGSTIVDQSPDNVLIAHLLSDSFPGALFIHLIRDGRAVYNSVRNLPWGPSTPLAAARWWSSWIAPGLALEHALGPDRVLRVRYEDLIGDPDEVLRRICEFAGIGYAETMISGGGVRVSPYASDLHGNVGKPPLTQRLDAWTTSLPAEEREAFSRANAALLRWLGYPVAETEWRAAARPARRLRWAIAETVRGHILNPLRQRSRRRAERVGLSG